MHVVWTKKGKLLLTATVLLYLGAAINEQPVMYFMASATAALLLVCFMTARAAGRGMQCERNVRVTRAVEGTSVPVHTAVRYSGHIPLFGAALREQVENLTLGIRRTVNYRYPLLEPGGTSKQVTPVDLSVRGRYRFGPLRLVAPDPLGIFEYTREVASEQIVVAVPRTFEIDPTVLTREQYAGAQGISQSIIVGGDIEVAGVREFMHGDDLRRVHWNSTARTGRLMVKQIEGRLVTSLTIVLDLCRRQVWGEAPDSTLEHAVRAAASLAERAFNDGYPMQLVCHERKRLFLPLDRGAIQFQRVLETLASVRGQGEIALPELLRFEQISIRPRSTAVVISASPDIKAAQLIMSLRRRNVHVIFVSLVAAGLAGEIVESEHKPPALPDYTPLLHAVRAIGAQVVQITGPGEAQAAFSVMSRSTMAWERIA